MNFAAVATAAGALAAFEQTHQRAKAAAIAAGDRPPAADADDDGAR